ncbi:MAG TPA: response regulator transcription factor [Blastocatellia bacterium]|nr:response regulator transcription factor [Blastocatellia bacterium]HMX25270.1 response regulator transcription factor [Blastocatellia bacterium]HMZ22335.1 response regulator transcription factor [Blastocatellia bacterium]
MPTLNENITLLIADDHPLLRHGLRKIIEHDPQLKVLAEAGDGAEALRLIETLQPAVAVLDIHMPGMTGFEVAQAAQAKQFGTRIVILTMYKDEEMFNAAMNIGVRGYILKDSALAEIAACVKAVAAGQSYISSALSGFLLNRRERSERLQRQTPGLNDLTPTERRVLKLVAAYKSSKEIADELNIHYRTVGNHRTNISQKLGLHGTHALVKFALEHKSEL